jgi:hypothetical protein
MLNFSNRRFFFLNFKLKKKMSTREGDLTETSRKKQTSKNKTNESEIEEDHKSHCYNAKR